MAAQGYAIEEIVHHILSGNKREVKEESGISVSPSGNSPSEPVFLKALPPPNSTHAFNIGVLGGGF